MNYRIVHVQKNEHSQAFSEVCELLHHSLEDLGHDVETSTKLSGSRRNIVVGANQLDLAISGNVEYVVLQLEQLGGGSKWFTTIYHEILHNASEVWDYDSSNIDFLKRHHIKAKQITLGYHEALNRITPAKKQIDVLHFGSMNPRRREVLDECCELGLVTQQCFGVYGADRDALIAQSKIVLNMHFYHAHIFEQARVSYLLNNGVTVVSESSDYDPYATVPFVRAPYNLLAQTCKAAIEKSCDGRMAQTEFRNKFDMVRILKEIMA